MILGEWGGQEISLPFFPSKLHEKREFGDFRTALSKRLDK